MKTIFMNFPKLETLKINGVYNKGKKGDEKRLFVTQVSTKENYIIWLEEHPIFGKRLEYTLVEEKEPGKLRQQNYNYYLDSTIDEDIYFDEMMKEYLDSDPMVPRTLTSYMHGRYSDSVKYPLYY